ncbi:MAG TPA: hypothetical protein VN628_04535 [Vicinamibacterales bacterium]|nr:hypothetical protein [Vicinamibacterales bacterium]
MIGVAFAIGIALAAAQQAAPPAQPGESPYRIAGRLPVRIMSFDVQPKSIRPGEKVTLTWATENPQSISIDPIGRVAPRGTLTLTPSATTTYTLAVTGASNSADKRMVTVTVQGTTAASATSASHLPKAVPRTADGHPDLSGVYGYGQAPGGRGGPPPAQPVLKPGAEKFKIVRAADDTGQYSSCMPPGIPQSFFVPYYTQIVQAPKSVVIAHEYLNLHRIIPTDGRNHPPDPDPSWMGNAVGRWDGDTLVVDSIGYNDKTEINGYRHTESLHIVERFSRPDFNTLSYEATIQDPNVFAQPWIIRRNFPLLPEYDSLNEFVCENNRDYKPLFGNK